MVMLNRRKVGRIVGPLLVLSVGALLIVGSSAGRTSAVQITILAEDVPTSLDIDGSGIANLTSQTGVDNLMEPLLYYKNAGIQDGIQQLNLNQFQPRLATSWTFNKKTLTWTFHLRKGVKSCAGNPFTADDVIYTYARGKSVSGQIPVQWSVGNISSVKGYTPDVLKNKAKRTLGDSVRKIDDYTIQIKQSESNGLLLPVMAHFAMTIFDKKGMEAHATTADPWSHNWANNNGVESFGPYCLESWKKGSEFIVNANTSYYLGKPPIDRIVFKKVPSSSNRVASLQAGAAQLVERLTPAQYKALRGKNGVKVGGVFGNTTLYMGMNWKTPPFNNRLVRQAVAYAMPYGQIISTGYFGQAKQWRGVIPPTYPGYHQPKTQFSHNLARAKALLKQAGYPNGNGLAKYANSFKITYASERSSTLEPSATVMRNALRAAGLPAELNPLPQAQFADQAFAKKSLPMYIDDQQIPIGVDAGYAVLITFISNKYGPPANNTNYSNPTVDKLALQMRGEGNAAKRRQLLARIQEIVMKDVDWVPIVLWKTQWAFSSKLSGVTWSPDASLRWSALMYQ
jgi:peptide/nickel transport system substrate-binding protein